MMPMDIIIDDWIEAELNIQSVNKILLKNCNLKFYFG